MSFFARLLFLICLWHSPVEAKVFNISNEKFGSYLLFTGGPSAIGKDFFEGETSSNLTYSKGHTLNTGAEFGFLWASQFMNLRFGLEILKPANLTGVAAANATDTLYTISSNLTGYVPKVGAEFNLQSTGTNRSFLFATVGSGSITATNEYDLTAAGSAAFPGVVDHTLKMNGAAQQLAGGLGFEGHLSDSTTYLFELGYRQMVFSKLKAAETVTTFNGQVYGPGDIVKFADGTTQRSLDFTGYYISLGLRIYIF